MGEAGEDMAAKPKKDPLAALMAIPGVGKATAQKLSDAGIKSAAGVNKAGAKGLAKAGLSAAISKKLLAAVAKNTAKKATNKAKSTARSAASKTKAAAAKAKTSAKKTATKAKSTAKKAATQTKAAASKAAAAGQKVAEKTVSKTGEHKVKTEKSKDGRKGRTLKVPRSVKDMAWFKKNLDFLPLCCYTLKLEGIPCQGASTGNCAR